MEVIRCVCVCIGGIPVARHIVCRAPLLSNYGRSTYYIYANRAVFHGNNSIVDIRAPSKDYCVARLRANDGCGRPVAYRPLTAKVQ